MDFNFIEYIAPNKYSRRKKHNWKLEDWIEYHVKLRNKNRERAKINYQLKKQKMKKSSFEGWLNEQFIDLLEINGVPITKDNCEDMFDSWLENKDVNDIIQLAEEWGKYLTDTKHE